jgi:hypothetical protein
MRKNLIYWSIALVAIFVMGGCAPNIVRYKMDEPQNKQVFKISGLSLKDEVVEIFDTYSDQVTDETNLWICTKQLQKYSVGKLNVLTGEITDLTPITNYDRQKTFYWTMLNEQGMGAGAQVGNALMAMTIGQSTDKYGFSAEKVFWGDPDHKVMIDYQYKQKTSSGYSYSTTTTQSAATQKFIKGEEIYSIGSSAGYSDTYALRMVKKARYYPVSENTYVGFQPNSQKMNTIADMFVYDISKASSIGADMDFGKPNYYIDAAVTKDGKKTIIVTGMKGAYSIIVFNTSDVVRAVKLMKAIQ